MLGSPTLRLILVDGQDFRRGRRGGRFLDIKGCLVEFWLEMFGTGFFSNVFEETVFLAVFVVRLMGVVIFSQNVLTLLWSKYVKILKFTILIQRDNSIRPRCMLWPGWSPALDHPGGPSPWAESALDMASSRLECACGPCSDSVFA